MESDAVSNTQGNPSRLLPLWCSSAIIIIIIVLLHLCVVNLNHPVSHESVLTTLSSLWIPMKTLNTMRKINVMAINITVVVLVFILLSVLALSFQ